MCVSVCIYTDTHIYMYKHMIYKAQLTTNHLQNN